MATKAFLQFMRKFSTGPIRFRARVQGVAPDFKAKACFKDEFPEIKLADYKGKYLVFFFYPLNFSFLCPTELIAFEEKLNDFQKLKTEVLGCSIDSHFAHLAWQETDRKKGGLGKLNFPVLSDIKKEISRSYGVLLDAGFALRATFIIDPKQIIRQITVNDLPIGRSVDETLRLVEACKFVDDNGEVCPANWNKNKKTIKPTVKGAKEYFEATNK